MATEPETDAETVERLILAEEDIARISESAEEKRRIEPDQKIRFEDIMEDPNNVELNFRYAQQQMSDGNFLGASGTLERILMNHPELPRVRLLYAMVLYRLDDLKEAERELNLLIDVEMPEGLRENLKYQRDRIRLRRKTTVWTLRQNLGYEIDDNRNTSASAKKVLLSDELVDLTGSQTKQLDTAFISVTDLNVAHDLGFQEGHQIDAGFTYFLQEQTVVDNLDLSSFRGEIGATLKHPWMQVRPQFYMNHIFLSRETFLRSQGMGIGARRTFRKRLTLGLDANLERQDYVDISENPAAHEREGPQYDLDANVDYALTASMRAGFGLGFTAKNADESDNSYEALALNVSHVWLLRGGQFLVNNAESVFDYYDEVDTATASRHRRDRSLRYRVTYGAPLSFFKLAKILPKLLEDIVLTFSYEYYRSLSTITNFTYRNNKYQLMLSKTWRY